MPCELQSRRKSCTHRTTPARTQALDRFTARRTRRGHQTAKRRISGKQARTSDRHGAMMRRTRRSIQRKPATDHGSIGTVEKQRRSNHETSSGNCGSVGGLPFRAGGAGRADVVLTPYVGSLFGGDIGNTPGHQVSYGGSAAFMGAASSASNSDSTSRRNSSRIR